MKVKPKGSKVFAKRGQVLPSIEGKDETETQVEKVALTDYAAAAKAVFEAHNRLRTDPGHFIPMVESDLEHFKGMTIWRPGKEIGLLTREGKA